MRQLILRLTRKDHFPRIWVASWENRDLRQLPWHRHRMVEARTWIMNQLQAVALNEGLRCKERLWREAGREQLESFSLASRAKRLSDSHSCSLTRPIFVTRGEDLKRRQLVKRA
jgi:transposase